MPSSSAGPSFVLLKQNIMAKHAKHREELTKEKPAIAFVIDKLVKDRTDRQWTIEHLGDEGPGHKQLQNDLLFQQLALLVRSLEKRSGKKLEPVPGHALFWGENKERIDFPLPLPADLVGRLEDPEEDLQRFAEGPEHETLMYSVAIQVLAWAAATIPTI